MVVLLPLLDGERMRACPACTSVGLCSPILPRSHFYRAPSRAGGFSSCCRRCEKARATRYQRETGCAREYQRRRRKRLLDDPVALERARERARDYDRRYAEQNRERIREEARVTAAWKRAEPVAIKEAHGAAGPLLPIKPFRDWIEEQIAAETRAARIGFEPNPVALGKGRVALSLDVAPRTLYRYRYELTEVAEGVVDRALSRDGRLHLYDLYPEQAEVAV